MGNKLKKAAPWIAGIILIWHAYGAVDAGGDSGPKMKESLLRIPHDVLKMKPEANPKAFAHDPFFIEWSPYGPTYDPVYIAKKRREQEEKEKAERAAEQKRQLEARAAKKAKEEKERQARIKAEEERRKKAEAEGPGGARGFEPFYLTLESVLASRDFATARVSGITVEPGDTLDKLDRRKPPRVERIQGTRVTVLHRGKRYVLDLLGETQIAVGGIPRDAPASAAAPGGAPRRSGSLKKPPKKSAVGGGGKRRRPGSLKKPPKKSAVTK
ncbi:MAG: hypothetical protein QNJ98_18330 [Planctomycetota bacterium]|nr:hypothetical protein [Planctomycetota bacterium]